MKKIIICIIMTLMTTVMIAQDNRKFNPQQFEKELEEYVVNAAGLTQQESNDFLPLFKEMRKKTIEAMGKGRRVHMGKNATDKEIAEAITAHDQQDVETKKIQQTYHQKFLEVLPAKKVMKIIRAEEEYHREAFDKFRKHHRNGGEGKRNK